MLSSRQTTVLLFESDVPLQEEILKLSLDELDDLNSRIEALDLAAKRALFAERVPKPVFFDSAFNYIDLPLDELLKLAGKKELEAPSVAEKVAEVVVPAVKYFIGDSRKRDAMSATAEKAVGQNTEDKPKGWLGGWFGGRK